MKQKIYLTPEVILSCISATPNTTESLSLLRNENYDKVITVFGLWEALVAAEKHEINGIRLLTDTVVISSVDDDFPEEMYNVSHQRISTIRNRAFNI